MQRRFRIAAHEGHRAQRRVDEQIFVLEQLDAELSGDQRRALASQITVTNAPTDVGIEPAPVTVA